MVISLNSSWFHDDFLKFCIHLRNLNVRHFNGFNYGIKKHAIEVIFSGKTPLSSFMKIGTKLINVVCGGHTDWQISQMKFRIVFRDVLPCKIIHP
jgi:hypothetical protein